MSTSLAIVSGIGGETIDSHYTFDMTLYAASVVPLFDTRLILLNK